MTTQELKEYIDKVLGNSIRCLLPSYWWKKLFGLVVDKIDEVDSKFDDVTITSDTSMSDSSTNPVQNKVIKAYVDNAVANVEIDVDTAMSSSSTNPVQNKVIYSELAKKQNTLVSGTNIRTINKKTLLGSGDIEIADAPSVILVNDETAMEFIAYAMDSHLGVGGFGSPRGFALFYTTDSSGEPTSYEFCEVDVVNVRIDAATETMYGFYEFSHDGSRYRRTYDFNTSTFVGEEVIASGGGSSMLPIYVPVGYTLSEEEIAANITAYNEYHSETNKKLGYAIVRILHNDVSGSIPMSILNWYGDTFTIGDWDSGSNYDTFAFTLSSDGSLTYEGFRRADASLNTTSTQPVQNKVITAALNSKVDIVEGKQLSTEDFTTAFKTKLEGLSNYDDTEISEAVEGLQTQLNTLVSGDASTAIESFNEIIAFLNGVEDTESLDSIIASIEQQIAAKQDAISDLDTIRSGASLGATALQEHQDISHLATKDEVTENEEVTAAALNELNDRVNEIAENVGGNAVTKEDLDAAVTELENADAANSEAIATVDGKVTALGTSIAETYATKTEVQTEVTTLNGTITELENKVIDNEEVSAAAFNNLHTRIEEIAANVGGSAATKEELAAAVATLEAADTATNESINAVDGKVDALEASVAETYATKTEVQTEVDTLNGTITALRNEVIVNEEITAAALSDLDARIKDLISRLEALTTQSSVLSGALEIDEDGDLHSTTGIYSDTFISARGKDSNV